MIKRSIIKITVFVSFFCIFLTASLADAPEPTFDQPNNIRTYLTKAASKITHDSLSNIKTLSDWKEVRDERYNQFIEMMGLTDVPLQGERPPLNVQIVGTMQQKGYKIVKLYYESLPDLYVPADLYIPDNITKPVPAVLYVCGHSRTQKVHYQAHPRKWAQLGFVCLIIETIQWHEVLGEHWGCYARGWFNWYSRGYNPGGVELWNAIRGLDLLCQRKEVDASRLGVTGISGGGSQSFYIAAADPRIKVAAPVCGGCTLEAQVGQHVLDGHCDCMMPINTYLIDFHDIGALVAPRPFMIAQANRDGLNPIESTRQTYQYINNIYDLYGAGENCVFVETPGPHSYHEISRTRIFSFFIKHLMGKDVPPEEVGDIDESDSAMLSVEELSIYNGKPPEDDRTTTIQDSFQTMAQPPVIKNMAELLIHKKKVKHFLKEKTFRAFPAVSGELDIKKEYRAHEGSGGNVVYSFTPEDGYRLKVDCKWREEQTEKKPVLLVLRNPGEGRWDSEGFASGTPDGWNRAYFEARGIGETSWGQELQWHIRRAAAWTGRTIASMRVYDVMRCVEALRSLPNVDGERISIAARGEMAVIALYAALMDGGIHTTIIQDAPATQNAASQKDGRGEAIEMLNCLRITDSPQVAGMLYPTKLVILGKPHENYNWSTQVYTKINHSQDASIINQMRDWKP